MSFQCHNLQIIVLTASRSYGRLEKIYITFPKAFWHGSANPVYPSFTQFLSPDYVDHPKDITWNQNCISLADLPGGTAHPTLLFYVYGPCATEMVKMITDTQPESQAYYDKLDAFLLPFYARLPNYSTQSEDCKPIAFLATQWQNDKFAGNGSYTNYQVGLKAGDEDIEIMRAGLPERGLWFAGEHTAPFIALGTTTVSSITCSVGSFGSRPLVTASKTADICVVGRLLVRRRRRATHLRALQYPLPS